MAKEKILASTTVVDGPMVTATVGQIVADITDKNVEEAADHVLFPEIPNYGVLRIDGKAVKMRPLPIKHAQAICSLVDSVSSGVDTANVTMAQMMILSAAALINAAHYLLQYYGLYDSTVEWVTEHLTEREVQGVVDAQMQVEGAHTFLLKPLLLVIETVNKLKAATLETGLSPEPPSSSPSVNRSESDSINS